MYGATGIGDAECALLRATGALRRGNGYVNHIKDPLGMLQEHFAGGRELHPTSIPFKKDRLHFFLEDLNLLTKRWLRHMEFLCRAAVVKFACDKKKVSKTSKTDRDRICITYGTGWNRVSLDGRRDYLPKSFP